MDVPGDAHCDAHAPERMVLVTDALHGATDITLLFPTVLRVAFGDRVFCVELGLRIAWRY